MRCDFGSDQGEFCSLPGNQLVQPPLFCEYCWHYQLEECVRKRMKTQGRRRQRFERSDFAMRHLLADQDDSTRRRVTTLSQTIASMKGNAPLTARWTRDDEAKQRAEVDSEPNDELNAGLTGEYDSKPTATRCRFLQLLKNLSAILLLLSWHDGLHYKNAFLRWAAKRGLESCRQKIREAEEDFMARNGYWPGYWSYGTPKDTSQGKTTPRSPV